MLEYPALLSWINSVPIVCSHYVRHRTYSYAGGNRGCPDNFCTCDDKGNEASIEPHVRAAQDSAHDTALRMFGSSLRHLDRFDAKECLDKLNQLNVKAGLASSEQHRFKMRGK